MKVHDPSGQPWRVTRRWVPWRRRVRDVGADLPDGPGSYGLGDDPISLIIAAVGLVLLLPFLFLSLLALVELLALVVVMPFAILARVLLGRHWVVEARRGFSAVWEDEAGDWAASRARIEEVAARLSAGDGLPTDGHHAQPAV